MRVDPTLEGEVARVARRRGVTADGGHPSTTRFASGPPPLPGEDWSRSRSLSRHLRRLRKSADERLGTTLSPRPHDVPSGGTSCTTFHPLYLATGAAPCSSRWRSCCRCWHRCCSGSS